MQKDLTLPHRSELKSPTDGFTPSSQSSTHPGGNSNNCRGFHRDSIDAQMNGYAGQEFSSDSLTVENVAKIGTQMDAFCVTRTYPTVTTNSLQAMVHSLQTIAAACHGSAVVARQFPGIHVEGPFISPHDGPRGAHPAQFVRKPDWDVCSAPSRCRLGHDPHSHCFAGEYGSSAAFIHHVVDSGVVVSIGHTAATAEQIHAAAGRRRRHVYALGQRQPCP